MVAVGMFLVLIVVFAVYRVKQSNPARIKSVVTGLMVTNAAIVLFSAAVVVGNWLAFPLSAAAAPVQQTASTTAQAALGAALSTGLAAIGAGIAVGISGAAAIGAITEKPETLGRTLIFVGLSEGIAIYGLIISFMILTRA